MCDVSFLMMCSHALHAEVAESREVCIHISVLSRYAFGVIVCCLALTTVVLTLVGMILGVAGWRKDRSPNSRTKPSHCGGIVLLV